MMMTSQLYWRALPLHSMQIISKISQTEQTRKTMNKMKQSPSPQIPAHSPQLYIVCRLQLQQVWQPQLVVAPKQAQLLQLRELSSSMMLIQSPRKTKLAPAKISEQMRHAAMKQHLLFQQLQSLDLTQRQWKCENGIRFNYLKLVLNINQQPKDDIYGRRSIKFLQISKNGQQFQDGFIKYLQGACILYFIFGYNLYFLLMDNGPSNYQALLSLLKELYKEDGLGSQSLTTQNLLEIGTRRVISLQMESKDKKELIRFCEQLLIYSRPKQEMKIFEQTLEGLLKKPTIKHIVQLQDFNNVLADLFLEIYEHEWKEKKEATELQLKLTSMLRSVFIRSHHKVQIQEYKDKLNCIRHKMFGWITCKETQEFLEQYRFRAAQIASFKEDCLEIERINRSQAEYILSLNAIVEQLRRKLKVYQSKQIMQANEEDFDQIDRKFMEKEPSIIELPQQSCPNAQESTTKLAIIKQIDVLVQSVRCSIGHSECQTELLVQTAITQTEEKTYDQTEIQTQINKMTQFEIQTEDSIKQCQQIQTHSIEQLLQQYEHLFRGKLRSQALFQGDVFLNHGTIYKERLIKHIEEKGRRAIKQTRMIYRYDPLNIVNFHRYIDNVQGLIFVVKTISGMYLAGFYAGKLIPDKALNQFGLLISLNNDESYILLDNERGKNNRSMVYDNFYAIFGNAQLRVKTGQDFIFSNFGIMNAYFNHQGKKVNDFLGENINREAKFEIYEFYQVLFEQQ